MRAVLVACLARIVLALSAVVVVVRDVGQRILLFLQLMLFASPVAYGVRLGIA